MAKFRAIKKGYYGDVIHDPDTDHHVIFEAPDDFSCSWAVRADADAVVEPVAEASAETAEAEEILDTEAAAAAPVVGATEDAAGQSEDIPADAGAEPDVNKEAGVEIL